VTREQAVAEEFVVSKFMERVAATDDAALLRDLLVERGATALLAELEG
jgi:hypothetical protein